MTPRQIRILIVIVIVVAAGMLAVSRLGTHTHDATLRGWYQDAGGYAQAVEEQRRTGRPIAVYFYTQWCESCKKFRESVLTAAPVKSYLQEYLTVHIDLEAGPNEAQLGSEFGVVGFPAFYIKARADRAAVNILRTTEQTPEDFMEICRAERARQAI
ncbi:MAG: thioredoxin family protein [Pseudomonadota bacterium]